MKVTTTTEQNKAPFGRKLEAGPVLHKERLCILKRFLLVLFCKVRVRKKLDVYEN